MRHTDAYRLERIIEIGDKLSQLIHDEGITPQEVLGSYKVQWTLTTPLYNIGEQVYCLSPELKQAHPELPWSGVAGLRHRLVHDYEGTNWRLVCAVVFDELPKFVEGVRALRAKLGSDT